MKIRKFLTSVPVLLLTATSSCTGLFMDFNGIASKAISYFPYIEPFLPFIAFAGICWFGFGLSWFIIEGHKAPASDDIPRAIAPGYPTPLTHLAAPEQGNNFAAMSIFTLGFVDFENETKDALKKLAFNRPMRDTRPITAGERVRQYRAKRMVTVNPPRPAAKPT